MRIARYAAFALGLTLAACGGPKEEAEPVNEAPPPAAAPAPDTTATMDSTMHRDTSTTTRLLAIPPATATCQAGIGNEMVMPEPDSSHAVSLVTTLPFQVRRVPPAAVTYWLELGVSVPAESPLAAAEEAAERAAVPAPAPTTPAVTFGEKPTATFGEKPPAKASEKQAAMVSDKPSSSPPPPSRVVRAVDAERGRPSNAGRSGESQESARIHEAPPRAPTTVRPAEPGRAESGGTTDGSEAVDWLLKQRN